MSEAVLHWPCSRRADTGGVVVVAVNYNTRDLIALLVWSIHRALGGQVQSVLVVDNGSTDGSRALLEGCREAGLCELIANNANRYHGPALNQAMSHLAARERDALVERSRWVWLLDSDCLVVRGDVLTDAISAASARSAALVGERWWDPWHGCDRLALHSLLMDPARVWRPSRRPFGGDGDPAYELERSCVGAGLPVLVFPFVSKGYVVHRGRGTLASVRTRREDTNRLFQWATTHHQAHFELVPGAAETHARLLDEFHDMVPTIDVEHLVCACKRDVWPNRPRRPPDPRGRRHGNNSPRWAQCHPPVSQTPRADRSGEFEFDVIGAEVAMDGPRGC